MNDVTANVTRVRHRVGSDDRRVRNGHTAGVLWFSGLSGAGKSTLAAGLEETLFNAGAQVVMLDGDNLRHGLSAGLGFSPEDRTENIRRAAEVAAMLARAGMIVITSFISPTQELRQMARRIVGAGFHEVFIDAPLNICISRDPKGLYARAVRGEIAEFTGISAPYEAPEKADLVVPAGTEAIDASLARLTAYASRAFEIGKF